jgi:isoleucyl-tRNA synthetase
MTEQRERSRTAAAGTFKGGLADHSEIVVKYHTATHLMYRALRNILGDHVIQRGSNITAERLRFDFSHPEKMTPENRAVLETASDWPFLLQMSEVLINGKDKADAMVRIEPTKNAKCERCWRFRPDVGGESKHPTLCKRCADVVS